jgi:uncharacterized protein YndB with AHSA1/START domain
MQNLQMTYLFHKPVEEVFDYFIRPELFELWGAPTGLTLKVHNMDARPGGRYEMTHSAASGNYACNGIFKEFIPNKKLVQIDNVFGPDGSEIFHGLECVTEFSNQEGTTKVTLTQSGFKDEKSLQECKKSWEQCFDKLEALFIESSFSESSF